MRIRELYVFVLRDKLLTTRVALKNSGLWHFWASVAPPRPHTPTAPTAPTAPISLLPHPQSQTLTLCTCFPLVHSCSCATGSVSCAFVCLRYYVMLPFIASSCLHSVCPPPPSRAPH